MQIEYFDELEKIWMRNWSGPSSPLIFIFLSLLYIRYMDTTIYKFTKVFKRTFALWFCTSLIFYGILETFIVAFSLILIYICIIFYIKLLDHYDFI